MLLSEQVQAFRKVRNIILKFCRYSIFQICDIANKTDKSIERRLDEIRPLAINMSRIQLKTLNRYMSVAEEEDAWVISHGILLSVK